MRYIICCCCLVFIIQGCRALKPYPESSLTDEAGMCLVWLESIDDVLDKYGITDPEAMPVEGFPHLRTNRFLASLSDQTTSPEAFAEWLAEMRQLGSLGIQVGFANLPVATQRQLVLKKPEGGSFAQALEHCGKRLNKLSIKNPGHKKTLSERVKVPDAYQIWKRIVGLYPIARQIAAISIERLHRELNKSFKRSLEKLPMLGKLIRYVPQSQGNGFLTPEYISAQLVPAYVKPLGIPRLTSIQLQKLFAHYAPIWEIDTRNDTDKIGKVKLDSDNRPQIEVNQPTVYAKHSYTRWHGKVLLQLSYQIWLPAREKTGVLDLYGGILDSVIWRVTLSPEGLPLAFDSIHACGCYYLLFPGQGYRAVTPKDGVEPVLSPQSITAIPFGKRLLLRLQSRTHYLQQVAYVDEDSGPTKRYNLLDLDQLRSLPLPTGVNQSLFGDDGIIDASARVERFILWPYGIDSPGAMRQWGAHAIAFIGRRHFDDAFLLEQFVDKE